MKMNREDPLVIVNVSLKVVTNEKGEAVGEVVTIRC
jgi:hypothetical protein